MPYFGICFGMQMAVIEAARSLAGVENASSTEFGPCDEPVVGLMTEWMRGNELEARRAGGDLGGTMRLGAFRRTLKPRLAASPASTAPPRSASATATATRSTSPTASGWKRRACVFAGMSPDGLLPEIVEIPDHPWFIGVQYHPELKSRPFEPHPLFASFIAAAKEQSRLV